MSFALYQCGYNYHEEGSIWLREDYKGIDYSDGDEVELRIASIIDNVSDLGTLSGMLQEHCTDWPSLYHLSSNRANLLRPFQMDLCGDVLEIGAGCGAITRYLGECGGNVLALEGSPRRAAIARARTRDLNNVQVVCDKFDDFRCSEKFDVVTLIGVLEYANIFTKGESPALSMLERARSFLNPNGKLIIAIENQLGLKYFAGAPEDHLGIPMYGIEARYQNNQPQTFGRKKIACLIKQAGFSTAEFLAPFPDYKFPIAIVTERGFSCDEFDAGALAWQSAGFDPQLPSILNFNPELVWPDISNNGLALDLANSFLIVASPQESKPFVSKNALAWNFTTNRKVNFCKIAEFIELGKNQIEVHYKRIQQGLDNRFEASLIRQILPEREEYRYGELLFSKLVGVVIRDGWRSTDVCFYLKKWLIFVSGLADELGQSIDLSDPHTPLPGSFFDLIPKNIVVTKNDVMQIIDSEWVFKSDIEVGYLVLRALLSLTHTPKIFGRPENEKIKSYYDLIFSIINEMGWSVSQESIYRWLDFEQLIQSEVGSQPTTNGLRHWLINTNFKIFNSSQAIAFLNQEVVEKDSRIALLNQEVSDLQIFHKRIVSTKAWKVVNHLKRLLKIDVVNN